MTTEKKQLHQDSKRLPDLTESLRSKSVVEELVEIETHGFGFDALTDDYKVVKFVDSNSGLNASVYSLSGQTHGDGFVIRVIGTYIPLPVFISTEQSTGFSNLKRVKTREWLHHLILRQRSSVIFPCLMRSRSVTICS
ncbi:unnamed protein product [Arabis nemorensis]|uniref:Uncharacterized protein n=1 Tax=Arabis nemorensis TaxID=586526 RepID=A0A565B7D2_9BRAS|nr:unnamed protein product [Arabis nemorensis]